MTFARSVAVVCALVVLAGVAACNTVEGVGQDLQAGGRAIEKAASKTKR